MIKRTKRKSGTAPLLCGYAHPTKPEATCTEARKHPHRWHTYDDGDQDGMVIFWQSGLEEILPTGQRIRLTVERIMQEDGSLGPTVRIVQ